MFVDCNFFIYIEGFDENRQEWECLWKGQRKLLNRLVSNIKDLKCDLIWKGTFAAVFWFERDLVCEGWKGGATILKLMMQF